MFVRKSIRFGFVSLAFVSFFGTQAALATPPLQAATSVSRVALQPQTSLRLLGQATRLGAHAPYSNMRLTVSLKLRNVDKLKAFLDAVQDPHSPQFRQFLTPGEFTAEYGPTRAQVDAVVQFLRQNGIRVRDVSPNRLLIHTEATTRAYEHAFGIMINDYRLNGRQFFSTVDQPKLPAAIAGVVQNVIGLNNAAQMRPHNHIRPLGAAGPMARGVTPHAVPPVSTDYYNPLQIANAYEWPSITDTSNGAGVTIAILTASSSDLSADDYNAFWNAFGLPSHSVTIIPVDGDEGGTAGTVETLLDMEWSGAMAPGARLYVYVAANPEFPTFTDMYNQFVVDNDAQVMTTSWGAPEVAGSSATNDAIFMQAAAQGISMFAAAGDNGASDGTAQSNMADYPSTSLYVASANGTELQADIDGNYISERAWEGTGGAISGIFAQPAWQVGPGVPDNGWRNNSDMAMNAGGTWPYLLVYNNTWYLVWGTSAVAPEFGGLFAIGVSQQGRIGQSNKVIYDDVAAGNYASDFRDVVTGNNGTYDTAPNWDHPTGWGSPRATSFLSHLGIQGPHGSLTGTVTDAGSGEPIPGAMVTLNPGHYFRNAADDGSYSLVLPAGTYTATVTEFYHQPQSTSVTVNDGEAVTQDFTLAPALESTVSGHVTDGSGHGYGLYAEIEVTTPDLHNPVARLWTDPGTGAYSVKLPQGHDYKFAVTPQFRGYNGGSATVSLNGDVTQDFQLAIADSCTAPGYGFVQGFGEDFDGSWPPTDWTVVTPVDNGFTAWMQNTGYGDANYTGGPGNAAEASGDHPGLSAFDTRLISPPIPVSSLPPSPVLVYDANYQQPVGSASALDLDISTDNGATWTTVLHWMDLHGDIYALPGETVRVPLGSYLPASGDIRLRWRYYDTGTNVWDWYAQVDDVHIGTCTLVPGGLVFGRVTDSNTGSDVHGARVADDQGHKVATIVNDDPNLPAGTYMLFSPSGSRTLTASGAHYQEASARVSMADDAVVKKDFTLAAGRLAHDPAMLDVHVKVNGQSSQSFTLQNSGTAALHYQVLEADRPLPPDTGVEQSVLSSHAGAGGDVHPSLLACTGIRCGTGRHNSGAMVAAADTEPGFVVSSFDAGLHGIYGLGVDRNTGSLWIGSVSASSSGGDNRDHEFLQNGVATGESFDVASLSPDGVEGDMAYDDNTGMFWQIGVSANTFCIYELDPIARKSTGRGACPDVGSFQMALAFDPTTNTWFTGDYNTQRVYHIDQSKNILDSASVKIAVIGLAYNTATGHLFALASGNTHDVYVLDTRNNYKVLSYFDVAGLDGKAGAGLDYDCDGHLWISDYVDSKVFEVQSGETGWCDFKKVAWLSELPAAGTIDPAESATVTVTFDGTGQQGFTTSESQLVVQSDAPHGAFVLPVKVTWDPQPINLILTASASADSVAKLGDVTYTVNVTNQAADDYGVASQTTLTYILPAGARLVSTTGDAASCGQAANTVTCDFGTLKAGVSATEAITIKPSKAGQLSNAFSVSAREPEDRVDDNSVAITTTVRNDANLSLVGFSNVSMQSGQTHTFDLTVANAGPDAATDVALNITAGGPVKVASIDATAGHCTKTGSGASCAIGDMAAGGSTKVTLSVAGSGTGTITLNGKVTASSTDADAGDNVSSARIDVVSTAADAPSDSDSSGGGGAFGWLALLILALIGAASRRSLSSPPPNPPWR